MLLFFAVRHRSFGCFVMLALGSMMFVQLLGAIGAVKLVALAGNRKQRDGRKKEGE